MKNLGSEVRNIDQPGNDDHLQTPQEKLGEELRKHERD